MALAQQARNEALAFPEGFSTEQARQLHHLEGIAVLIGTDAPDIELERLTQEGDWDGVLKRLRSLQKGGGKK